MKVFIGADHRGFALKQELTPWLVSLGHEVIDCGNTTLDKNDDYPDFAFAVAEALARQNIRSTPGAVPMALGIVICGSGVGATVAANKVIGMRAGAGISAQEVKRGREDDDMNILALSADFIHSQNAKQMITVFLTTPFLGQERHTRRLGKIFAREKASYESH